MSSVIAPETLTEMLHHETLTHPDTPAAIDEHGALSFRELWESAQRTANALAAAGVNPGDSVGLFLAPSNRLLIAVWAILKANASYLPLAVDYPAERISFMITDSRIQHVIVDAASHDAVEHLVPGRVQVLQLEELLTGALESTTETEKDNFPAYIIYTSGSTGRPKGVVIEHRAIVNQMCFLAQSAGLGPGERILLKTPVSFDAAQWELLANAAGATVVVGQDGIHRDPEAICDLILEHEVNLLQAVPTLWTALLEIERFPRCRSLTRMFSGGEVLATHLAKDLLGALPQAQLVNFYGPTETTINATWFQIEDGQIPDSPAVSIGSPVPGCQVHILDEQLHPVPEGQVGELCISGLQLAAGYLHRPDLTAQRFVETRIDGQLIRVYRSGDSAKFSSSGSIEFCGRLDDQVKVNGHRVETDEVRLAIEAHHWVRQAAVVPWRSPNDATVRLGAFVELDPAEAALMDQEAAGDHHRSKSSHVQVKAQLATLGVRTFEESIGPRVTLPGREGTSEQFSAAYARKTYRFFEGDPLKAEDLIELGQWLRSPWAVHTRHGPVTISEISEILRWLGPFHSDQRLLPKYAYASPGALNATQVYLETAGIPGLDPGLYYYNPIDHELLSIPRTVGRRLHSGLRFHFAGLPRVIESVYSTNVLEVLYMEAGHIAGVLDRAAAEKGMHLEALENVDRPQLGLNDTWEHTASFDLLEGPATEEQAPLTELSIQVHGKITGVRQGTYRVLDGALHRLSDELIERRNVIAINQETYTRSAFGVTLSCRRAEGWVGFRELGRALQQLQMNQRSIGLMSSGYSSLSGRDLPAAVRYDEIAQAWGETESLLSYFAVGGPISEEQILSRGMKEDSVHLRGPEEIIKDDLRRFLPYYMLPSRVEVVDELPKSSSGKADRVALIKHLEADHGRQAEVVPPASALEADILAIWSRVLARTVLSVTDDFFDIGGNSLTAVKLIGAMNERFQARLPVQSIFEAPTARDIARRIRRLTPEKTSRLVPLATGEGSPLFLWPGLGGYPMGLRPLAASISRGRPVHGVQAFGLNPDEHPYETLSDMVSKDGEAILAAISGESVTLMGYSFGARMAAEVAAWLDERGVLVDRLTLIAPGSPLISGVPDTAAPAFTDPYFRAILMSVFTGSLDGLTDDALLATVCDRRGFLNLLKTRIPALDRSLAERIVEVVIATYGFRSMPLSSLEPMLERTQVLIAAGDGTSFVAPYKRRLEACGTVVELDSNHYQILREPAVDVTARHILTGQEQPV